VREHLNAKKIRFQTKDVVSGAGAMLELAQMTGGKIVVPSVAFRGRVLVDPDWKQLSAVVRGMKRSRPS
jgi:hypothetical protein